MQIPGTNTGVSIGVINKTIKVVANIYLVNRLQQVQSGGTGLRPLMRMYITKICPCNVYPHIYIVIAIALDESIFLDVLHFPMKNIMSRGLEATPMGGLTSKLIQ